MRTFRVDYDRELNEEQQKVVFSPGGPSLVIAGAGSGKTRTITYRVAWLLESGVPPQSILLATFTNKAAREMLHRVEFLLGIETRSLWGGTFHHICNLILRREAQRIGYNPGYTILDREDQKDFLEICVEGLNIDTRERRFPKGDVLLHVITLSRNTLRSIESILEEYHPQFLEWTGRIAQIAALYQDRKRALNVMDYDDLLWYVWSLFRDEPDVRRYYGRLFQHILVDEYQDTNLIQAEIVDALAEVNRNLLVVGDDAQSIYSFRGANFENIIRFPERYPDCQIYKLETNYRSTKNILQLANQIIRHNIHQFPKELRSVRENGEKPVVVPTRDVLEQADFVASKILDLRDRGYSLNDIAVLYRAHYQSMELQLELTQRNIPFEIRSGIRFFEQAHIKDVVAYLKIVVNPLDEVAWKRVLKLYPGIGKATAEKIWQLIQDSPDPIGRLSEVEIQELVSSSASEGFRSLLGLLRELEKLDSAPASAIQVILKEGYEAYLQSHYMNAYDRIQDIEELATFALRYDSLEKFLNELVLVGSMEGDTVAVGGVPDEKLTLSTVHQAKGLEWPCVFVIWLCEGGFPASPNIGKRENIEEERRLFYVACTRAKDFLFLTYPILTQGFTNRSLLRKPSRFIQELDGSCYHKYILYKER
ncbi:MAG: UvrD-helicase domain-containing protein [Atribacterota bacterium]|nr:UvrD-helicase domain-containing protein [Atribacterota bacterium]